MKKYTIDTEKSTITWTGKNKNMTIKGDVAFEKGNLFVELDGKLAGKLKVDLESIKLTSNDQLDADQKEKFLNHLTSEDFFDTNQFPFLEYEIKEVTEKDNEQHHIFGLLKVKDNIFGLNTVGKIDIEQTGLIAESSFEISNVNDSIKDEVTAGYDGDPIQSKKLMPSSGLTLKTLRKKVKYLPLRT